MTATLIDDVGADECQCLSYGYQQVADSRQLQTHIEVADELENEGGADQCDGHHQNLVEIGDFVWFNVQQLVVVACHNEHQQH